MRGYKVYGGVATIGAGELVAMSEEQFKIRAHNFEPPIKRKEGAVIAKAINPVQFKVGEEIGLEALSKSLIDILAPLEKPKGAAEKLAAEKADAKGKSLMDKIKDKVTGAKGDAADEKAAAAA